MEELFDAECRADWDRMVLTGLSQGAGMAAYIAKWGAILTSS